MHFIEGLKGRKAHGRFVVQKLSLFIVGTEVVPQVTIQKVANKALVRR